MFPLMTARMYNFLYETKFLAEDVWRGQIHFIASQIKPDYRTGLIFDNLIRQEIFDQRICDQTLLCHTWAVLLSCFYPSFLSLPEWQLQLTLQPTGLTQRLGSWMSTSSLWSDSLGFIKNHGVGAVISSLSSSNPQQVEAHRIIKMSGGKCYSYIEIVTNQSIFKAASSTQGRSWKVASHWKCFTDGLLCWWMNEHVEKVVWLFIRRNW